MSTPTSDSWIHVPCLPVADIELPAELARFYDLAYNLWWTWKPQARFLFRSIDPEAWELYENPVQLLINVERTHWAPLLESASFMDLYREVVAELDAYLQPAQPTWFARRFPNHAAGPVAYFSMEYGLHSSLAIYSGGLGVLSGDHCKAASDLGLPLVAVGLAYRRGYFHQTVDGEGRQQHNYPDYDFSRLAVRLACDAEGRELRVSVPLPGRQVACRVWVARVGRINLLLLDTHVPENHPADRQITGSLYVSGREMRLVQELVVGVGGARTLAALGIEPAVWHINEGHSALLQLERLERAMNGDHRRAEDALGRLAERVVFTTHTPVPAGNEAFERPIARKYLDPWAERLDLPTERLLALGEAEQKPGDESFNLTAVALRTSRSANAVSKLNAEVTSAMWGHLLPPAEEGRLPIFPITNGVHAGSWVGREMRALFARWLGPDWQQQMLDVEAWASLEERVPAEEVWLAHLGQKERLARFTRDRLRDQFARHGRSPDELRAVDDLFDPEVLTIGFARRFATYKRAKLVFSDLERLEALLADAERPVQLLFAGKAHPADQAGQALIQQIFALSQRPELAGRVFFVEDYDMRVGQRLVQGVDVWLNTPRRPMEASGTSGQKAAMNGALNLSILDGWWPEAFDGGNGWAIRWDETADAEEGAEQEDESVGVEAEQDRHDAEALYRLLEDEVVPAYYHRNGDHLPLAWVERMKHAIATITPHFSASRMVRDYAEQAYFPDRRG